MFLGKLAMPHTTSGWIFIILLFVGVIVMIAMGLAIAFFREMVL